jgi:hypothetical protein
MNVRLESARRSKAGHLAAAMGDTVTGKIGVAYT